MDSPTRPLIALYVIWHPSYAYGREIADRLRSHFDRDLYKTVGGEHGMSVLERSESAPGASTPLPIDWDDAEMTAAVVLAESRLLGDHGWADYVRGIARSARTRGIPAGFFPVTMDSRGIEFGFEEQGLRWDLWDEPESGRNLRLASNLTHEFCRLLRHRLGVLRHPDGEKARIEHYLEKIQVFISHSKHDNDGESVANSIREWIHTHSPLASFFDVYDIPPGLSFEKVLLHQIGAGAVMAVHTDSYSSSEWCRREVIEAKRRLVPMVVVDCVRDIDPREIPYLGNTPVIRMDPDRKDRIETVAGCLLDEIFRTWLWLCRVGRYQEKFPNVLFTARPPELVVLAAPSLRREETVPIIVYPEPLLSADEERLFSEIAPNVSVQTLTEWLEGRQ